jgi:hypothetical protein
MEEKQNDIVLRQAEGPDVLQELLSDFKKLMPTVTESAGNFLKGKGCQEIAKAQEIYANITQKIGQLELERQRLIGERNDAIRKVQLEEDRNKSEIKLKRDIAKKKHEERIFELKNQRLHELGEILKALNDCGIVVDLCPITKALYDLIQLPPSR